MAQSAARPRLARIASAGVGVVLIAAVAVLAVTVRSEAGPSPSAAATPVPDATLKQACIDGAAVGTGDDALASDCALLLAAKDTLRGTATLNWSTDLALANWTGVSVYGNPRRVRSLWIRSGGLDGSIPGALGGLSGLYSLSLRNNELTGAIPAELGSLAGLTSLDLQGNELTGEIPPELAQLRNLMVLYLRNNAGFTGCIPHGLGVGRGGSADLSALDLPNCVTHTLTTSAGENGSIDPAPGTHTYDSGRSVTVTAAPGDGYRVASWGGDCSGTGTTCTLTVDADKTASVTFEVDAYTLTTSAGENGSIDPAAGAHRYGGATSVTVTATPDEGYTVAAWGGDCSSAGTATTCTLTMDADKTASVTFGVPTQTLTVTVTGTGGEVTPSGTTEQDANSEVTLTASWNDATHSFTGWTGDCVATTSTCVVTMDAGKAVTATFAALPADRCATATAADCIRAVYQGAPDDYAQVADIPADKLLTAGADGRYHVRVGQQYTVVTAAQLPSTGGWTRFYLERDPGPTFGVPSPVSFSQLIKPIGTTYTFTVSEESDAPAWFTYDLTAAKPHPARPSHKPVLGDVVVKTSFQTPRVSYSSFDSTGAATTAGSYSILMPDDDSDDDDATIAVTTYEQLRTKAAVLVVNETDGDALDQSTALDAVEVGDVIQWGQDHDCWTRYQVASTPAPAEGATTRTFGVKWHMYSFSGCSGSLDASAATVFNLEPGPHRMVDRPEPIRYGPWQLIGYGWAGAFEINADSGGPPATSYPASADVETVKQHRLWRDPDVPDGWELGSAFQGFENIDGYEAVYGQLGVGSVTIQIRELHSTPYRRRVSDTTQVSVVETMTLDGLPAWVSDATGGAGAEGPYPSYVFAYDESTRVEYLVMGTGPVDQIIEIARSLWASE